MKKFLTWFVALIALAVLAITTLDVGTGFIADKGARYIAQTYNVGVSIDRVAGNPVRGYTLDNLKLLRNGRPLLEAGQIFVDPSLLKLLRGITALDWVELTDIRSTIPDLVQLGEIFTGEKFEIPEGLPLDSLILNKVGGTLDGNSAEAAFDIIISGLPVKATFKADVTPEIKITDGIVETCRGTIALSGNVTPIPDLRLAVSKLHLEDLVSVVPQIKELAVRGAVNSAITLQGSSALKIKGSVELSDGSIMALPISAKTNIDFDNMDLTLSPLSVSAIGIPARGDAYINLKKEIPSVRINISTEAPVTAKVLRHNLPSLPADLSGGVERASVSITGPVTALSGNVTLEARKLTMAGASLDNTRLHADASQNGTVKIKGRTDLAGNPVKVSGTITTNTPKVKTVVAINAPVFDLSLLPAIISDAPENLRGKVKSYAKITGTGSDISAKIHMTSPKVSLNGMSVEKIDLPLTWKNNSLSFDDASLIFMDLPITDIRGTVTPGSTDVALKQMSARTEGGTITLNSLLDFKSALRGNYELTVKHLDLSQVMNTFGASELGATGLVDAYMTGLLTADNITGNGNIACPHMTMAGLTMTDITSPVKMSDMILKLPGLNAAFADGKLTATAALDMNSMSYSLDAGASGAELKNIISQAAPTLDGGMTGKISGSYKASGRLNPFTLSGKGEVSSSGGELYGFKKYAPYINLFGALHGNRKITYAKARIPFTTDERSLNLQNGTEITAHENDGIYRFIRTTGLLGYAGNLDLDISTRINAMLVDTAAGALSGALSAGAAGGVLTGGIGGVAGFLGGAAAGAKKNWRVDDFRDFSFHVSGNLDAPKASAFKVGGKTWKPAPPEKGSAADKVQNIKNSAKNALDKQLDKLTGGENGEKTELNKKEETAKNISQKLADKIIHKTKQENRKNPVPKTRKEELNDQINDAIQKEIEKGLNSLFKKL